MNGEESVEATGAARSLNPLGLAFSQLRRVWPSDRFLWPAAQLLGGVSAFPRGGGLYRTAEGFVMSLDPRHYPDGAMLYGTFEVSTARIVAGLLRPGDAVVDIGANIGYHCIRFSRLVGPGGRVFAFEPMARTRARLAANLARNGCANVTVIPLALSDAAGEVAMYEAPSHGEASLRPLFGAGESHPVRAARLDDGLPHDGPIRLMKLDIEGAERLALRGAGRTIATHRPHVLLEKNAAALRSFDCDFADVVEEVTRHGGYVLRAADGGRRLDAADRRAVAAAPDGNYLLSPG